MPDFTADIRVPETSSFRSSELSTASIFVGEAGREDLTKSFQEAVKVFNAPEFVRNDSEAVTPLQQVGFDFRNTLGVAINRSLELDQPDASDPWSGKQTFQRLRTSMNDWLDASHPAHAAVSNVEKALDACNRDREGQRIEASVNRRFAERDLGSSELRTALGQVGATGDEELRKNFEAVAKIFMHPEFTKPEQGAATGAQHSGYHFRDTLGHAVARSLDKDQPDASDHWSGTQTFKRLRESMKGDLDAGHPAFAAVDALEKTLDRMRQEREQGVGLEVTASSRPASVQDSLQTLKNDSAGMSAALQAEPSSIPPSVAKPGPVDFKSSELAMASVFVSGTANPDLMQSFNDTAKSLLTTEFVKPDTGTNTVLQQVGFDFRNTLGVAVTRSLELDQPNASDPWSGAQTFKRLREFMGDWIEPDHPALLKVNSLEKAIESHIRTRDQMSHNMERSFLAPDRVDRVFHTGQHGLDSAPLNQILETTLKTKNPELAMAAYNVVSAVAVSTPVETSREMKQIIGREVGEAMKGAATGDSKAATKLTVFLDSIGRPGSSEIVAAVQNFGKKAGEFVKEFSAASKDIVLPVINQDRRAAAMAAHIERFKAAASDRGKSAVQADAR